MRKYELWLDETGKFTPEEQIDGSRGDKVYSIIGGVLMPEGYLTNERASELVGNTVGHATELDVEKTRRDLVPALCTLKDMGGQFVFFENQQRITSFDHKELYMEMMVEGILQLMSFLSTFDQQYQLDIVIAIRYLEVAEHVLDAIPMDEYYDKLKNTLRERIRTGYMNLDDDVQVNILFSSARKEPKLMLADYACGARRAVLRKHDSRYTKEDRDALREIFDEHYIFDCYEYPFIGKIKHELAANKIAEAILLVCNEKNLYIEEGENVPSSRYFSMKEKMKWMIEEKMKQLGKLEVQYQIEELLNDVNSCVRMEDEYEWGEVFLGRLREDFLETLKKYEEYDDLLELEIALSYAYLYLKEGDMVNLEGAIQKAEESFGRLPQCFDFVKYKLSIWVLKQAKAVYSYDFASAKVMEAKIEKYADDMAGLLEAAEIWKDGLFVSNELQKESIRLKELRSFLEWALNPTERKEEEAYLSKQSEKIEIEAFEDVNFFPRGCFYYQIGKEQFSKALSWLFLFNGVGIKEEDIKNSIKVKKAAVEFCDILLEMDGKQKTELIRDYLYALTAIKKWELQAGVPSALSEVLYLAIEETFLLESIEHASKKDRIVETLYSVNKKRPYRHLVRSVLADYQDEIYHPMEQIWWYLARYYSLCREKDEKVNEYYLRGIQICKSYPQYSIMNIMHLLIRAERSGKKLETGGKRPQTEKNNIKEAYESLMLSKTVLPITKNSMEKIWQTAMEMLDHDALNEAAGYEMQHIAEALRL